MDDVAGESLWYKRYAPLSQLNHAFDLMKQGEVKRSVIVYE